MENNKEIIHYKCPDCGWKTSTKARRIRCSTCGSLNLERQIGDGSWWKADRPTPKICRDCQTKYESPFCHECGGSEVWDPNTDDPDWFKKVKPSKWAQACQLRREYPSVEKRYTTQEVVELIGKYDEDVISHINEAISRAL